MKSTIQHIFGPVTGSPEQSVVLRNYTEVLSTAEVVATLATFIATGFMGENAANLIKIWGLQLIPVAVALNFLKSKARQAAVVSSSH